MNGLSIERRPPTTTPTAFHDDYLSFPGRPVFLEGVVQEWPAFSQWDFDGLRKRAGGDLVHVTDELIDGTAIRRCTLADFIDYAKGGSGGVLRSTERKTPWYLTYYRPFITHPEMLDDFEEPACIGNWLRTLREPMWSWYLEGFSWLLIGPSGTVTGRHRDIFRTHAWLAQLRGRKRITFYPPDAVDPRRTPVTEILEPGDFLVVPECWEHEVISLEPSITLTFNFINESNFSEFLHGIYQDPDGWKKKAELAHRAIKMRTASISGGSA